MREIDSAERVNELSETDSADETVIELSKTKMILLLLAACAFGAAGAWLLTLDAAEIRSDRSFTFFFKEPLIAYGLGVLSLLFSVAGGVIVVRKLFDKKPGLVLNSSGVFDNASVAAAGLIPWSDVVGSEVIDIQGQKMLIVHVSDPRKYVERGGALRRALNRAGHKMGPGPVAIPSNMLKIDFPDLVALFDQYRRKYGGH